MERRANEIFRSVKEVQCANIPDKEQPRFYLRKPGSFAGNKLKGKIVNILNYTNFYIISFSGLFVHYPHPV
jgi:hypothetical protein